MQIQLPQSLGTKLSRIAQATGFLIIYRNRIRCPCHVKRTGLNSVKSNRPSSATVEINFWTLALLLRLEPRNINWGKAQQPIICHWLTAFLDKIVFMKGVSQSTRVL